MSTYGVALFVSACFWMLGNFMKVFGIPGCSLRGVYVVWAVLWGCVVVMYWMLQLVMLCPVFCVWSSTF